MLKFIRFALYVITFTCILQQPTFTAEQENVRSYLRDWANRCGNVSEVARRIDVPISTLRRFIEPNSTSGSPTVLSKFQVFQSLQPMAPISQPVQTVIIPPYQNVLQPQIQTTPPMSITFSPSEYQMPLVVVMPHRGPVSIKTPPLSSFEQQLVSSTICSIQSLLPVFLPKLKINQIYEQNVQGLVKPRELMGCPNEFEVRSYGPDPQGRFAYITKTNDRTLECFSLTIPSPEPRLSLGKEYQVGSGYQLSHGPDCLHTPFPNSPYTSNKDSWVLVAQNPTINMHFRTAVTQRMSLIAYGEEYLYEQDLKIWQKRKGDHHVPYDRWIVEDGFIPTGSVLKALDSSGVRIYFLLENDASPKYNPTYSIYENLYDQAKRYDHNATYERSVVPQFEVRNVALYFQPVIYRIALPEHEKQRDLLNNFFLALNVHPFLKDKNASLSILKRLKVPYSWNWTMGLTTEQVQRLCHAIHSKSKPDPDIVFKYPYWNGFRLPFYEGSTALDWKDASEAFIPVYPGIFNGKDITRLNKYMAENLLEQVVKQPHASCRMKLGVAEIYLEQGKYLKANELLGLAFHQIEREGTLVESLWLARLYIDYLPKMPPEIKQHGQTYQARLLELIGKKKTLASLEELLRLKKFVQKTIGRFPSVVSGLANIERIGPENSGIIRNKYIPTEKVSKIEELINSVGQIQEFSLKDAIFTTTDCFVITEWFDEEAYTEDWVSTNDYYWQYQKPFEKIMNAVARNHSRSLHRLNLHNLGFGFFCDTTNKVTYSHAMANILKVLQTIDLPNLKELHLTGIIESSDEAALQALENLKVKFPNLEKLFYSIDSNNGAIELNLDKLGEVGRIFRNIQGGNS